MFQFYFKEKFDVLRMLRLLVSSRYRRVRKIHLHLVLFALFFIQYLKRIIHQSFVSTAPTCGDSRGIAGIRCWKLLFDCPRSAGEVWGYNIGTLTLLGFSVVYGGAKSRVVTISLSPQGGAYTRALKSENHYPRPSL